MPGSIPTGSVALFDCSQPSTIKLSGVNAVDGGLCDTAGTLTASGAARPIYDTKNLLGGPALILGAQGAPLFFVPSYLSQASVSLGTPLTLVMMARIDGTCVLLEASTNVATSQGIRLGSTNDESIRLRGPSGYEIAGALGQQWVDDNQGYQVAMTADGTMTGLISSLTGVTLSTTTDRPTIPLQLAGNLTGPGVGSITCPVVIGADHAGLSGMTGAVGFAGLWPRILNANERTNLTAYLQATWPSPIFGVPIARQTFSVGDSTSIGQGTVGGAGSNNFPYADFQRGLFNLGDRFAQVQNLGLSGTLLNSGSSNILSQWSTFVVPLLSNVMPNVCFIRGGVNDIGSGNNGTATAAIYHSVVAQMVTDLNGKGGGPHLILAANIVSPGTESAIFNGIVPANVLSLATSNVHIRGIDCTSDLSVVSAYDGGGLHPTKPGYERLSKLTMAAILAEGL
jgi:lysophospholipase L1-like esterase